MNRRIGFRTSGLRHIPIDEVLRGMVKAGYEAVEFCLEHPEASDETLFMARELGLHVSAVSYHGKKDDAETRLSQGKRVIEIAEACNVNTALFGSPLVDERGFLHEASLLYSLCRRSGIKPVWETEPGTVLDSLDDFFRLIVPLGVHAGLNLDAGHLHLQGACTSGRIRSLGAKIHHVHVEGMRSGKHEHLVPGTGDMNWKELIEGLKEANYSGPLVIDLFIMPENWLGYMTCARKALSEILNCTIL